MTDPRAPKEIDRADVLGELMHRFGEANPNNAVAWVLDELMSLDILKNREPVDDPREDPDGTLRREDHEGGHSIFQAMSNRSANRYWLCVYSTVLGNRGAKVNDADVQDIPRSGVVPGTPAAEAVDPDPDIMIHAAWGKLARTGEPRVFQSDGPEPPTGVTYLEWLEYGPTYVSRYLRREADSSYSWVEQPTRLAIPTERGIVWPPPRCAGTYREVLSS